MLHAVVTAGGTREPIDDVRVLTNLSSGRFGAAIANALRHADVSVTLLASASLTSHPEWVDPAVNIQRFDSFLDLQAVLQGSCLPPPDLLFMAAAVSDYSPVPVTGKIRSTEDELVIHLRKNPKLLARLRHICGPKSLLVGFKLLSGVSTAELVDVARKQVRDNDLDLCVANDLQHLRASLHPIQLVAPVGEPQPFRGDKATVAEHLVRASLQAFRAKQRLETK
jgi:phosphopantothenoylcysteine synthetase/decarboxylase